MSTAVLDSSRAVLPPLQLAADQRIRQQVARIFQTYHQPLPQAERRCDRREPFPYPIYVTPIRRDGSPRADETFVVLGKHLSERGLDFYYQAPVPYRRVITSWECTDGRWFGLLLDLRWCRSNKHGWYENGGRFLRVVDSPLNADRGLLSLHHEVSDQ